MKKIKIFIKFNQYQKSEKTPFTIHANLEYLIEKIDGCKNSEQQQKQVSIIPSGFSMPTILSFENIENKHDVYSFMNPYEDTQ